MKAADGCSHVNDEALVAHSHTIAAHTGIFPAPEGGATLAALLDLKERGLVSADERVVPFNTGSGYKYLEALAENRYCLLG